jgi:hypothetical protein
MTTPTDTPRNNHTEALHPSRENQWQYHWFDPDHFSPPNHLETWKPSCNDDGCGHWNRCYDCNDFIATLLVDKAEFLARKQLEKEYPEAPHPNPSSLRPNRFYYGTDIDDENDPERKKYKNWNRTKDRRITVIALDIASDPTKTSNKEDLTTTEQAKIELTNRRYHYHTYLSRKTTPQKENKPPPQKKSKRIPAKSPPHGPELFLPNGDGSMFSVGYATLGPYKGYKFSP